MKREDNTFNTGLSCPDILLSVSGDLNLRILGHSLLPCSEVIPVCYNRQSYVDLVKWNTDMDKIKGFINDLTGGDGKVDADDIKKAAGDLDLGDLQAKAEEFGLGDLAAKADQLGIGNLDIAALGGLSFPLDKAGIISALKSANVSDSLLGLIEKVPDQVFDSLADLQKKLPI